MAYLVSFLVLEGLDLLQPRQHRDYHALEMDVEEVLDGYLRLPGSLAVFTQHLCFLLQLCLSPSKLDLTCDMERGNCAHMIIIGHLAIVVLATAYLLVVKHIGRRLMRNVAPLLGDLVEWGQIAFWLVAVCYYSLMILMSISMEPTISFRAVLVQMVWMILFLTSAALPFALDEKTFENRWFRGLLGLIRWFRELSGLKISEKGDRHFSILFATPNIPSIICYYMCIYDPSSTYKPPWTEYLG